MRIMRVAACRMCRAPNVERMPDRTCVRVGTPLIFTCGRQKCAEREGERVQAGAGWVNFELFDRGLGLLGVEKIEKIERIEQFCRAGRDKYRENFEDFEKTSSWSSKTSSISSDFFERVDKTSRESSENRKISSKTSSRAELIGPWLDSFRVKRRESSVEDRAGVEQKRRRSRRVERKLRGFRVKRRKYRAEYRVVRENVERVERKHREFRAKIEDFESSCRAELSCRVERRIGCPETVQAISSMPGLVGGAQNAKRPTPQGRPFQSTKAR